MLSDAQDAYGHGVFDHYYGDTYNEIVERDDGNIDVSAGGALYFAAYEDWSELDKEAISLAAGRVLDLGCGAGRACLHLQSLGQPVTGIDISPLAVKVCRLRGVQDARLMSVTQTTHQMGTYDTVLMLGNNWGLMGGFERGQWLLRRFRRLTSDAGRIVAITTDPYDTDNPNHLSYHALNRGRGRMGGQLRLRVRYKKYATPWFDYWLASRAEVEQVCAGTGWRIAQCIDSDTSAYGVVLEKA